ncbi:unnamed protein product [Peniophora sp. CBMAI 1063]|nr:unnamed protein product [Peniophora sp. CBMAI 1063]
MRLIYTTDHIGDTVLLDESGRQLYATTSSTVGRKTEIVKLDKSSTTLAVIRFRSWSADTIETHGRKLKAKKYLTKPSWWSRRRIFTCTSNQTYEWKMSSRAWKLRLFNGPEVGHAHSRSRQIFRRRAKEPAYLEFSDDPRVLNDLDEIVVAFVYLQIRREKDKRKADAYGAVADVAGAI